VERILGGDGEAEAELVESYGRGLALILDRHSRDREAAEDLYQETLATALVKLRTGALRDPQRLAAFLASIARNLAVEHYRKAGRRKTEADSETVDATTDPRQDTQLSGLLRQENAELVRRTVAELNNPRDREILYRFYLADEDKDSIARDLGLESLQFNRVLHRARQRYKVLFEERVQNRARAVALLSWVVMAGLASHLGGHVLRIRLSMGGVLS